LTENDPKAEDETQWRGKNYLGKVLDRVYNALSGEVE